MRNNAWQKHICLISFTLVDAAAEKSISKASLLLYCLHCTHDGETLKRQASVAGQAPAPSLEHESELTVRLQPSSHSMCVCVFTCSRYHCSVATTTTKRMQIYARHGLTRTSLSFSSSPIRKRINSANIYENRWLLSTIRPAQLIFYDPSTKQ